MMVVKAAGRGAQMVMLHPLQEAERGEDRPLLSSLPTYTVWGLIQEMVLPTGVGSFHLKQIKITPLRCTQRPGSRLVLDSVKLIINTDHYKC